MFWDSLSPSQLLIFSPQVGRGGQGNQRREGKGESQIAGWQAADLTLPALVVAWASPGYSFRVQMERQKNLDLLQVFKIPGSCSLLLFSNKGS